MSSNFSHRATDKNFYSFALGLSAFVGVRLTRTLTAGLVLHGTCSLFFGIKRLEKLGRIDVHFELLARRKGRGRQSSVIWYCAQIKERRHRARTVAILGNVQKR